LIKLQHSDLLAMEMDMKTADLILNLIREEESMTDALKKQAQGM